MLQQPQQSPIAARAPCQKPTLYCIVIFVIVIIIIIIIIIITIIAL